jgi:ribonuclease HIII
MIKDEQNIKEIVEEIKKSMNLEELDELERKYNQMYKELKEKEEQRKASTTNES